MLHSNYLKIIIGPMFSCKSSFLVKEINRYKHITNNIVSVNHLSDKKRTNIDGIRTHDKDVSSCLMLSRLNDLQKNEKYVKADVVIIDEAQFFHDLYEFIEHELRSSKGKIFIVAGLSGDFNLKPIGQIFNLIPLANEIEKLSALCIKCKNGTLAHFTKRTERRERTEPKEPRDICIGAEEIYESVCRFHYFN